MRKVRRLGHGGQVAPLRTAGPWAAHLVPGARSLPSSLTLPVHPPPWQQPTFGPLVS